MGKREKWSKARYASALTGEDGFPALRSVVKGFASSDGYNLNKFSEWTTYQRRRIREFHYRVTALLAQERFVVFPRSQKQNRLLQEYSHGDLKSRLFKGVFVAAPPTIGSDARRIAGSVELRGSTLVTTHGGTIRTLYLFDQVALARNPQMEIRRAIDALGKQDWLYVQANEYQTLAAKDAGTLTSTVLRYMHRYDGFSPIMQGRHAGDRPDSHYWGNWLKGVVGISSEEFERKDLARAIVEGMNAAKRRKQEILREIAREAKGKRK